MGAAAKVSGKGQITIPNSIREEMGIEKGDELVFYEGLDGRMRVRVRKLRRGAGRAMLHWPNAPKTSEEVRKAVKTAVGEARSHGSSGADA
ncbi:AbrB/MazE/SpoVT family DNA-binding domain-containing protein [Afifella sp. H1R]|uniref:AbrB/MazE/SpoVT family DNA-binding domain-containing protein n=1 Tax=Afifella sp. H1R TaxID=2908841 RepID=UPI001F43A1BC|nr:AbrB/MazE/SpoVT family DNA-binding domain-containing protein [Afifella sp. H1R]MCF1505770.1 AbrB/MazE/SpoVT family DNA-binding domain-containing protein [Afifella sp. H1R]